MKLEGIKIGLGITGSFCNFSETKNVISNLKTEGADVYPIISFSTKNLDTRFYKKDEYIKMLKQESKNNIIDTIQKAEPVGPKNLVDIILVCPCTGNSLAKLANGITDTPVLMAIKGHIRNNKPVVIGVSTNDGLGASLQNIAKLINTKNMYFVPFRQDDYISKPKSLVLDYNYIVDTVYDALHFKQIQPILSKK
ncbi:MAG: dipicolinate synthase subunit B [Clostridia bacterium]|nr:dipicolinate synthase subunit B [Clostridia bacterium]